ncbi:SWIB complex BAF60b domain-containing protein [Blastocystis sp. ATCC 50177/Nand II]|uniref:SWIB complex BAF60b domain-containing protein n=1 Tax=Blastocystis sp. subtype 1 (strain ATCC 50177 / NandII) TaxID=478820 RepID=A0A196SFK6_BLAHN|nr:SWIB complex BAF60b domain-containing protein [Blastocystis sp. ATCC 50177/Nand II]
MSDVSNKQLKREVFAFLARSDCSQVTRKQVRDELERIHGTSFKSRKEEIKDAITEYLNVVDAIAKSQEVKQEESPHSISAEEPKESVAPKIKKEPVSKRKVEAKMEPKTTSIHEEVDRLFSDSEDGEENSTPSDDEGEDRTVYVADDALAKFVGKETQFRYQMKKKLWRYIFENNLSKDDTVTCNEELKSLCGKDEIKGKDVYKLIMQHSSEDGTKKVKPKKAASKEKGATTLRTCKVFKLSPALKAIVGKDKETQSHVVKGVWKYIHEKNLQDPNNKRTIINDEAMKKVFESDTVTIAGIMKGVQKHLTETSETATEEIRKRTPRTKKEAAEGEAKPRNGYAKEYPVDKALADFVGSDVCSRTTYTKKVWEYIKQNNLQNPKNKREIVCDAKLKSVLLQDRLDMMHIAKAFSSHLKE